MEQLRPLKDATNIKKILYAKNLTFYLFFQLFRHIRPRRNLSGTCALPFPAMLSLFFFLWSMADKYFLCFEFFKVGLCSLDYNIWHSFCSFFYSRTYLQRLKLSIYDVIVVQKSSSREGKFTFYGWGYCLEKCVCWRWLHNVLETKCIKSIVKSRLSL